VRPVHAEIGDEPPDLRQGRFDGAPDRLRESFLEPVGIVRLAPDDPDSSRQDAERARQNERSLGRRVVHVGEEVAARLE
jgi:hypothetical protein